MAAVSVVEGEMENGKERERERKREEESCRDSTQSAIKDRC